MGCKTGDVGNSLRKWGSSQRNVERGEAQEVGRAQRRNLRQEENLSKELENSQQDFQSLLLRLVVNLQLTCLLTERGGARRSAQTEAGGVRSHSVGFLPVGAWYLWSGNRVTSCLKQKQYRTGWGSEKKTQREKKRAGFVGEGNEGKKKLQTWSRRKSLFL